MVLPNGDPSRDAEPVRSGEQITWHSVGLDLAHAFAGGHLLTSACGIGPGEMRRSRLPHCPTCERRLRLPGSGPR
jgi:hypothetical protein